MPTITAELNSMKDSTFQKISELYPLEVDFRQFEIDEEANFMKERLMYASKAAMAIDSSDGKWLTANEKKDIC